MAYSTIELRNLLKTNNFDLWDFDLLIDDQNWKERVKQTIEDAFFFYEIGSETPDRFKHRFRTKLNLILPYYNNLYNTTLLNVNPLINYSLDETLTEQGEEDFNNTTQNNVTGQGSSTNNQDHEDETSNTITEYPQNANMLNDIPSERSQLNNQGTVSDNSSSTSNQASTGLSAQNKILTKSYNKKIEGLTGQSYASLIMEHRQSIINIEQMIIKDLKPLFILVF